MVVKRLVFALLLLFWGTVAQSGSAAMQLDVRSGLSVAADCWPGAADKAAVRVPQGFWQTTQFLTVRRSAVALADDRSSAPTPTRTLGVDRRLPSLTGEAIQTQSGDNDVTEMAARVGWLDARAGRKLALHWAWDAYVG